MGRSLCPGQAVRHDWPGTAEALGRLYGTTSATLVMVQIGALLGKTLWGSLAGGRRGFLYYYSSISLPQAKKS